MRIIANKIVIIILCILMHVSYSQGTWNHPNTENWNPNGKINTIDVFLGYLVVGGNFSIINGASCPNVYTTNMTLGTDGEVFAIKTFSNILIVAGTFSTAGTTTVNNIAAWDGVSWSAIGSGINGKINALETDGVDLYAAGSFSIAGGNAANNIARWDGMNWLPLGSGTDSDIYALKIYNGILYAAGTFTTAGGIVCNRIAMWDGSNWTSLGTGIIGNCVYALEFGNLGVLFAGGNFYAAGGVSVRHLAMWDGINWNQTASFDSTIYALAYYQPINTVVAGGDFNQVCNNTRSHIVKTVESCPSQNISGLNDKVRVLNQNMLGMNYKLYAGGDFTSSTTNVNVPFLAEYIDITNGIEKLEQKNEGFLLYPIPTNAILNIEIEEEIKTIKIYNHLGEEMIFKIISKKNIDVYQLPIGVYFIEIKTNNGTARQKFIKE